jgi:hypothetical protein
MCVSLQESFVRLQTIVRESSWMGCERSMGREEWLRSAARDEMYFVPHRFPDRDLEAAKAAGELTLACEKHARQKQSWCLTKLFYRL